MFQFVSHAESYHLQQNLIFAGLEYLLNSIKSDIPNIKKYSKRVHFEYLEKEFIKYSESVKKEFLMLVGEFLDNFIEHVREYELVAIAGDFNASATDQGSSEMDKRKPNLLEVFSYLNLVLLKSGGVNSCRKEISAL